MIEIDWDKIRENTLKLVCGYRDTYAGKEWKCRELQEKNGQIRTEIERIFKYIQSSNSELSWFQGKASYILDDKEAGELESKYEDEGEVIDIKSSFIDGMSVINILQAAAGNDYQYIYIDSDGTVQLKVTESQKNTLIENMNQYLSSVSEQFKNLGDGYDISWNTDFSEISYKFDSALSKQDQSNYFTYTETIGMLNQLLKGDSNSYYIDLSIYNSSSGELVSKGNTKDGITWNIGE